MLAYRTSDRPKADTRASDCLAMRLMMQSLTRKAGRQYYDPSAGATMPARTTDITAGRGSLSGPRPWPAASGCNPRATWILSSGYFLRKYLIPQVRPI
jgi:hypothetical protein